MNYYHVSSYIKEGQILDKNSKNNIEYRKYISNCNFTNYSELYNCFKNIDKNKVFEETGWDIYKWICEAIFEKIRKELFSDMPSRVWGIFLFKTLEEAKEFKQKKRKSSTHIFKLLIPEDKVTAFDMDLYTIANDLIRNQELSAISYEIAIRFAKLYWSKARLYNEMECLTECVVSVDQCVE